MKPNTSVDLHGPEMDRILNIHISIERNQSCFPLTLTLRVNNYMIFSDHFGVKEKINAANKFNYWFLLNDFYEDLLLHFNFVIQMALFDCDRSTLAQ